MAHSLSSRERIDSIARSPGRTRSGSVHAMGDLVSNLSSRSSWKGSLTEPCFIAWLDAALLTDVLGRLKAPNLARSACVCPEPGRLQLPMTSFGSGISTLCAAWTTGATAGLSSAACSLVSAHHPAGAHPVQHTYPPPSSRPPLCLRCEPCAAPRSTWSA